MEIIELVEDCKLVRRGSRDNGHDCWGNYEYTSYKYVMINGEEHECFDGFYVVHDGKNVKRISSKFIVDFDKRAKEHFEKTGFDTPREYAAYLKGRAEIENNPELLQQKIQELRIKKLGRLKNN